MTVSVSAAPLRYDGNGVTDTFPYLGVIFADSDLEVTTERISDGLVELQILGVDYSVDGIGLLNGGNVITTDPVPSTHRIALRVSVPSNQDTSIRNQGNFSAEIHEKVMDRLSRQIQKHDRILDLCIMVDRLGVEDTLDPLIFDRAGMYLAFDANRNPIPASGTGNDSALRTDLASTTSGGDGSRLVGGRKTQSGSVSFSVFDFMDNFLLGTMFGLNGNDSFDNTAVLTNLLNATDPSNGGEVFLKRGVYRIASNVTTARAKIRLRGEPGTEIKVVGSIVGLDFTGDHVEVECVKISSTLTSGTPPVGLRFADASNVKVRNCIVDRVCLNARCSQSSPERNLSITDTLFRGDWTGWSGSDSTNVIDVRGYENILIDGNTFENQNIEKLIKVSCSLSQVNLPIGAWRSKRLRVTNNAVDITSTNGVSVIDFFASTEEVVIDDNTMNVQGTFAHVIHCKPGDAGTTQSPYQRLISVSDNTIHTSSGVTDVVLLNGAWGLAWFSAKQTAKVEGNTIKHDAVGAAVTIDVKGMNVAHICDNEVENGSGNFRKTIIAYNNQIMKIHDNTSTFGNIDIAGNGSTPDGAAYGNQPESVSIKGNTIDDFNSQGAVSIFNCTALEELNISDNELRNQTDTGSVVGCIHFSTVTVAALNMHDNSSNLAAAAKNIISGSPTATSRIEHDNSWNRCTFVYDPGNLADGAGETSAAIVAGSIAAGNITGLALGDWVRAAAPYSLQQITVTAYCDGASSARIRVQNESGGAVDLASGTWRITWGKG